jgi:hypothetical protein
VLTIWDVLAGCARFPSRADSTEDESDLVTEVCWPVVRAVTPDPA